MYTLTTVVKDQSINNFVLVSIFYVNYIINNDEKQRVDDDDKIYKICVFYAYKISDTYNKN